MVTVVCLSPSLDETIVLPSLDVGGTNRVREKRICAGGKGVNVALGLKEMGEEVRLAVFRHEEGAKSLFDALEAADVACIPVDVPGRLRTNLKLFDASSGTVTEVNASSEPVPEEAVLQMEDAVVTACGDSRWLVLTGSMPNGYPPDAYARMIRRVRREAPQCRIALDAEGEPFRLGVLEGPDLVKPNRRELEMLIGKRLYTDEAVIEAAQSIARGVHTVIVSMDVDGSVLITCEQVIRAKAIPVPVVTTVGAGDALVSGYIRVHAQGEEKAFAYGIAAATARVAGRDGEAETFLSQVQMQ